MLVIGTRACLNAIYSLVSAAYKWYVIPCFWKNQPRGVVYMMTSSNGNIFSVTGLLCGNSSVTGEFPSQRPVTRRFDDFFDLRLNEQLSKQSIRWWFETPSRSLWRHCNVSFSCTIGINAAMKSGRTSIAPPVTNSFKYITILLRPSDAYMRQ